MGKIIFIVGGARSGKSSYAASLAQGRKTAFIATCQALDEEMAARIALHKKERPASWKTFEEPTRPSRTVKKLGAAFEMVIIDCLTLLVSNLFLGQRDETAVAKEINQLLSSLRIIKATAIIVSNEVGLGIVPDTALGREFRDSAGRVNQIVAGEADEVFFMVAGIPWRIK
ncbi:MAG: bifunctional adenosylcobinamide kinase/adenosylcobinamide-phosphate guanylyltransferase [Candidatus Omnitrophica bacterium]|nr:bifunctional adenosylcobinamide kinase/adenosylcobinamide-phosphate guanylyltransferase [Candidatus Omnitrophota bacterium]